MRHINTYKLFESDEEEDYDELVQRGFQYSNNYIKDRLHYLTDEDFIYNDDKNQYLLNKDGRKDYRMGIREAHTAIVEFSLSKSVEHEDVRDVKSSSYSNRTERVFFNTYNDDILHMMEAIASFTEHFEDCKYNLEQTSSGYTLRFIITSIVSEDVRTKANTEHIDRKAVRDIVERLDRYYSSIRSGTPSFEKVASTNKDGSSMWSYLGSRENGYIMIPINTEGIRKQVLNKNMVRIKSIVDGSRIYIRELNSAELKEITSEDLVKLMESSPDYKKKGLKYFEDKYLGLQAVILDFDYDKWLKWIKRPIGAD